MVFSMKRMRSLLISVNSRSDGDGEGDNADVDDDNDGWTDIDEIRQGSDHSLQAFSLLKDLKISAEHR